MESDETAKGNCAQCDGHIAFPADIAGESIPCPHCGEMTVLSPAFASGGGLVPQVSTLDARSAPKPAPSQDAPAPPETNASVADSGARKGVAGLGRAIGAAVWKAVEKINDAQAPDKLKKLKEKADNVAANVKSDPARLKRNLLRLGAFALVVLAVWLVRHQPWKSDFDQAQMWANRGDADAQFELAKMYARGEGVERDQQTALEWGRKAAEAGNVDAQFTLGGNYYFGNGVKRDYKTAHEWYGKAAAQGDREAKCMLGQMHYLGHGRPKNSVEAMKWFKESENFSTSQYFIGMMHYEGDGMKKDIDEAISWFRKAAEQDDFEAQAALGYIYADTTSGRMDGDKAFQWLTRASEGGNVDATCYLGWCYVDGIGVRKNQRKGTELVRTAADKGSDVAKNWLRGQQQQQMMTLLGAAMSLGFGSGDGGISAQSQSDWAAQNEADYRAWQRNQR